MTKFFRMIRKIYQSIFYPQKFSSFGSGSFIESWEILTNPKKIEIGRGVYLKAQARLESLGGTITIGDGTQAEKDLSITSVVGIKIGKGVLMARNVLIADHLHNMDDPKISPVHSGIGKRGEIYIGDNCLIGTNAVILPGAKIGEGCVVGANSIVNREFPSYSIIAGVPGKVVKSFDFKKNVWVKVEDAK